MIVLDAAVAGPNKKIYSHRRIKIWLVVIVVVVDDVVVVVA